MFDKDLFFSLCEKYNVELSDSMDKPMIKGTNGIHPIANEDVKRVFTPCQTYFDYSDSKTKTNIVSTTYYIQDDFAIAC